MVGEALIPYQMKPLTCDPARIKDMSERLIVSHYENNYGGAVKRLNLIEEHLAELDYAKAAVFLINGLKREQLIAMNSMILHELFFDALGERASRRRAARALTRDFGSYERWRAEFIAMGKALGGGSGWVLLSWSPRDRKLVNQWASDHATPWQAARRSSRSICTSTPITWTSAPRQRVTWTLSWRSFAGRTWTDCSPITGQVKTLLVVRDHKLKPGRDDNAYCACACTLHLGERRYCGGRPGDRLEEGRWAAFKPAPAARW